MLTIEKRLAGLERKVRAYQLSLLTIVLIATLATVLAYNKKTPVADVVQAKEFQVVDDRGNVLVRLKKDGSAGDLTVLNTKGTELVQLTSSTAGSGAVIGYGKEGNLIYRFIGDDGGGGAMDVYNSNGKVAGAMGATDVNSGYLLINNGEGNKLIHMTYGNSSKGGVLNIYNRNNSRICTLGSDPDNNGVLNVYNSQGQNMNGVWPK
jgi:hypothetical protein